MRFAPDHVAALKAMGDALAGLRRTPEAQATYKAALHAAQTIEPMFQERAAAELELKLASPQQP